MSEIGRKDLLRGLAEQIQSLDPRTFPAVLNVDDVKVVLPIPIGSPSQFFFCQTTAGIVATDPGQGSFDIFRVGGLDANGISVSQRNVGESALDVSGNSAQQAAAALFDYRILGAHIQIDYAAAPAGAEIGVGLGVDFRIVIQDANEFEGPMIGTCNIGDGKAVDADETSYFFPISGNYAGFTGHGGPMLYPGFVPGAVGNGLLITLKHRATVGGAISNWNQAATLLTRVYGLRYPKDSRTW